MSQLWAIVDTSNGDRFITVPIPSHTFGQDTTHTYVMCESEDEAQDIIVGLESTSAWPADTLETRAVFVQVEP